jgi:hypothetical protein
MSNQTEPAMSRFDTNPHADSPAAVRRSDPLQAMLRRRLRTVRLLRDARRAAAALRRGTLDDWRQADVAQKALVAQWRQLHAAGVVLPLDQVGFSRFSEFEEDGILLYLMTLAGARSRTVVEISAQDGRVCMATNLIVHHRWRGFLFDGDPVWARDGERFFARHPATRAAPPLVAARWFTRETIDTVLADAGVPAEIDLLSLDIDGVDLHLWSVLEATRPRVLVCEFNNAVPSELALTIPYRPDFDFRALPPDQAMFRSASLAGFVAVSRRKGYRLVGMNALGFNAFFLRDDVLPETFPERPAADFDANGFAAEQRLRWWPRLARLPWVTVPPDGVLP